MPAKSKDQYKFMQGVCSGSIKKKGLSKKEGCEYIKGQSPDDFKDGGMKEKKRKAKIKALLKMLGKE